MKRIAEHSSLVFVRERVCGAMPWSSGGAVRGDDCRGVLYKTLKIGLHTDSTSARTLAMKQGLGRWKRMHMLLLFLQEAARHGLCEFPRVPTEKNPTNITTKAADAETLRPLRANSAVMYDENKKRDINSEMLGWNIGDGRVVSNRRQVSDSREMMVMISTT